MNTLLKKVLAFLKKYFGVFNKYWVATIIFIVVTFVFGNHNLYQRYRYNKEIRQLKKDITHYNELNEKDLKEIEELRTSDEALEKYAREELMMVKPGEEVFIIKE